MNDNRKEKTQEKKFIENVLEEEGYILRYQPSWHKNILVEGSY